MPIYTFTCQKCGSVQEHIVKYAERDDRRVCAGACGGVLRRHGVESFVQGKESYQMKAITADGSKIKGHFGKAARKKGGWHRP